MESESFSCSNTIIKGKINSEMLWMMDGGKLVILMLKHPMLKHPIRQKEEKKKKKKNGEMLRMMDGGK